MPLAVTQDHVDSTHCRFHSLLQEDEFPEPEGMDMDVGNIASALTHKLIIDDIDESDRDNPQLCAEYVKEIYSYMQELEVCWAELKIPYPYVHVLGPAKPDIHP